MADELILRSHWFLLLDLGASMKRQLKWNHGVFNSSACKSTQQRQADRFKRPYKKASKQAIKGHTSHKLKCFSVSTNVPGECCDCINHFNDRSSNNYLSSFKAFAQYHFSSGKQKTWSSKVKPFANIFIVMPQFCMYLNLSHGSKWDLSA